MNVGIFTDTYFPQVSGVATSIKTLRNELQKLGHNVYIFTTTDPKVTQQEENIFRFSSIPFISFTDRRIAIRGLFQAYEIAKELNLDIIHTQTEFSMGMIGKFVARNLNVPCLHTYHTMYEDYLHYVANGKLLKPIHVKEGTLAFCHNLSGVIAPSDRVLDKLTDYGVKSPLRIIPTGIDLSMFGQEQVVDIREKHQLKATTPILLSVSRLAYEKNIKQVIEWFQEIIVQVPEAMLLIVGDGPAKADLVNQVNELGLTDHVIFVGEVDNEQVNSYYRGSNVFVSASSSESQGLTYIEALASGVPSVVSSGDYTDELLDNPVLGTPFKTKDEFIAATINYLIHPVNQDAPGVQKIIANKLVAISATTFANRVVDFYQSVAVQQALGTDSSVDVR